MPDNTLASDFDVIVIGGGINGLVAATLVARAKKRVVLIEAAAELGGRIRTEDVTVGFRSALVVHDLGLLSPKVVKECQLKKHGLTFTDTRLPTIALSAAGRPLVLTTSLRAAAKAIGAFSTRDAETWPRFSQDAGMIARSLRQGAERGLDLDTIIRDAGTKDGATIGLWARAGIADLVESQFELPLLRGFLAFEAVRAANIHPRTPGTPLLLALALSDRAFNAAAGLGEPKGGPGGLIDALARAARANGVTIMCGTPVARIDLAEDAAHSVTLSDGSVMMASAVISAIGAEATLMHLVGPRHLDVETSRDLRATHASGGAAKVVLALDHAPSFRGLEPEHYRARLVFAPDISAVEAAAEAFEQGNLADELVFEAVMPSVRDPMLTEIGQHTLSAMVPFVPAVAAGDVAVLRDQIAHGVLTRLDPIAPDLRDRSVGGLVLTPNDIAARFGAGCGHWSGTQQPVSDLISGRRAFGVCADDSNIAGLRLAGADAMSLAAATGLAGRRAAKALLRQLERN